MNTLTNRWLQKLELLDIAFQPILNIHTGKTYAVEALLRNFRDAGFKSIFELFDTAYKDGVLYSFDLALREKTFKKFTTINNYENIKLFYNLDNRLLSMPDFKVGNTNTILKKLGIKKENICFEISERHEISGDTSIEKIITHYKSENFCIAIDDFGVGYSGYKLLFDSAPDIIKIDRYFLQDIDKNMKKQLMLRSITNLSIQLGIQVIAEGVETEQELLICKEIGCHLVQGYLVQYPTQNTDEIVDIYQNIVTILKSSKRNSQNNTKIQKFIQNIPPLYKHQQMDEVVEYFKKNKTIQITPVVNKLNEPVGIFYDNQIKEYLYSPYGISLLHNDTSEKSKLKNFIIPCANSDINSSLETIIELFTNNPDSAGIIITKNSSYYGFLSARAIISIMNEENLIVARDQNPLTKLPGNRMIQKYISKIEMEPSNHMLCYFDLDNFKAFNDVYGFRNGDRVIQLFADIMRKNLPSDFFKAHIGGDDFFVANRVYHEQDTCIKYISEAIAIFCQSAKDFYSKEDKDRGHIIAKNRDGELRKFPLLTVSASIILTNKNNTHNFSTCINDVLSVQKKVAKNEPSHIAISSII
ncbi:GGDEF domain-containing protein [Sulfurimonas sp. SAG-AH-194-C21]|nr:GGDEF domain-containing protein [Sulfurimonas sp. SAG-AH-194-C21]MDF1883277.1 GGDEF domain-containing protein [Sulfurimonas sp. SAG-AH-194-C21]